MIAFNEAQIAKTKKNCESSYIKLGETQKEAEGNCREEVEAARNLMYAKSPNDNKAEQSRKQLEDSLANLDRQLANGSITEKEYNKKTLMAHRDFEKTINELSAQLEKGYDEMTIKK